MYIGKSFPKWLIRLSWGHWNVLERQQKLQDAGGGRGRWLPPVCSLYKRVAFSEHWITWLCLVFCKGGARPNKSGLFGTTFQWSQATENLLEIWLYPVSEVQDEKLCDVQQSVGLELLSAGWRTTYRTMSSRDWRHPSMLADQPGEPLTCTHSCDYSPIESREIGLSKPSCFSYCVFQDRQIDMVSCRTTWPV